MKRISLQCIMLIIYTVSTYAQELNATVTINSSRVESNNQILQILENDLRSFINERVWTDVEFISNEKIDCSFVIIISEAVTPTSFKGELQVQSRRPIYNTTYMSPMLNYRDGKIAFDYIEGQPLEFNVNSFHNNLTSIIAYYIYLILGLDFDSMSPLGGSQYFQSMQAIATNAQAVNVGEWGELSNLRDRSAISVSYNNPFYEDYRMMWYEYHRTGLDEMALNIDVGRKNILTSLSIISSLKLSQPNSILLNMFGDTKLDEIVDIYSNGDINERQSSYESLRSIFPTKDRQLERLIKLN